MPPKKIKIPKKPKKPKKAAKPTGGTPAGGPGARSDEPGELSGPLWPVAAPEFNDGDPAMIPPFRADIKSVTHPPVHTVDNDFLTGLCALQGQQGTSVLHEAVSYMSQQGLTNVVALMRFLWSGSLLALVRALTTDEDEEVSDETLRQAAIDTNASLAPTEEKETLWVKSGTLFRGSLSRGKMHDYGKPRHPWVRWLVWKRHDLALGQAHRDQLRPFWRYTAMHLVMRIFERVYVDPQGQDWNKVLSSPFCTALKRLFIADYLGDGDVDWADNEMKTLYQDFSYDRKGDEDGKSCRRMQPSPVPFSRPAVQMYVLAAVLLLSVPDRKKNLVLQKDHPKAKRPAAAAGATAPAANPKKAKVNLAHPAGAATPAANPKATITPTPKPKAKAKVHGVMGGGVPMLVKGPKALTKGGPVVLRLGRGLRPGLEMGMLTSRVTTSRGAEAPPRGAVHPVVFVATSASESIDLLGGTGLMTPLSWFGKPRYVKRAGGFQWPAPDLQLASLCLAAELVRRVLMLLTSPIGDKKWLWTEMQDLGHATQVACAWVQRALYERVGRNVCDNCGAHDVADRSQHCAPHCIARQCTRCAQAGHAHVGMDCNGDDYLYMKHTAYATVKEIVKGLTKPLSNEFTSEYELLFLALRYMRMPWRALGSVVADNLLPRYSRPLQAEWDYKDGVRSEQDCAPAVFSTDLYRWASTLTLREKWLFTSLAGHGNKPVWVDVEGRKDVPSELKGRVVMRPIPNDRLYVITGENILRVVIDGATLKRPLPWVRDTLRQNVLPALVTRGVSIVGPKHLMDIVSKCLVYELLGIPLQPWMREFPLMYAAPRHVVSQLKQQADTVVQEDIRTPYKGYQEHQKGLASLLA